MYCGGEWRRECAVRHGQVPHTTTRLGRLLCMYLHPVAEETVLRPLTRCPDAYQAGATPNPAQKHHGHHRHHKPMATSASQHAAKPRLAKFKDVP